MITEIKVDDGIQRFMVHMLGKRRVILCDEKDNEDFPDPLFVAIPSERVAGFCEDFVEYAVL